MTRLAELGPRLRAERLRLMLSQLQVANTLGISRETYGRYERGNAVPGGAELFQLAELDFSLDFLRTGRYPPPPPTDDSPTEPLQRIAAAVERIAAALEGKA